jgi:hypothetical protein
MGSRVQLQTLLETLLGSSNVYFQPPENLQMHYPCIVYRRNDVDTRFANNLPYTNTTRYQIMTIDRNPDSLIPGKIASLPMCSFDRHYTAQNLNHDVYNIYY